MVLVDNRTSQLTTQHVYRINGFSLKMDPVCRHQLLAMGIRPGLHFRVARTAPLGDPLQLEAGQLSIALRKKELEQLVFCQITP